MNALHRALRRVSLTVLACAALAAHAQSYPTKPVKIIVPFAPGGAVDAVARVVGNRLAEQLGQPFVIESKPGANMNIGTQAVVSAPADGYTLLLGANPLATNPTLDPKLPFDPQKDLAPIARIGYAPLVLVVPAASPAKSVKDLVANSKAKPGSFNYGSAAAGGSGHLATELLKIATGLDAQHVAYKGGAPALTDLIGGRLDLMIINPLEAAPHVKAGTLRALAVSSPQRIPALPDTPTFEEAGVKGFEANVWWSFSAPAATPRDIVAKLSTETLKALENADVRAKLEAMGAVVAPLDAAAYGRFLAEETRKWAGVIRTARITSE